MHDAPTGFHADAGANAVAVFTSGGDAPGMNAVVRSVARLASFYGRKVFAIYEGYQGLVDGGERIRELDWDDTRMIIHQGGTVIGSARCAEFRERPGRLRACENLVKRGITNLICCGGDGSLTGANIFKLEWPSLLEELLNTGRISQTEADSCKFLNLVGCVGSIDNDMVYDGTLTIGTDTSLHRIVDAIDAVASTASSHQRTFVLEIMGRHCGYLAWAAGVATGADFVFIPEMPPNTDDWESLLCETLDRRRQRGARLCMVLVAEGAIDRKGQPIKTDYVRQVICDRLKHDTRATILGHVQRGGQASAYDRLIGTMTGAMAVEKLRRSELGDDATIVGIRGFSPKFNPLVETIAATQLVGEFTAKLDFESAILARKKDFKRNFEYHKAINRDTAKHDKGAAGKTIAILCSGAPAGGMNAAIRAGCHYAMNFGYHVLGVHGGLEGFCAGDLFPLDWMEVQTWASESGCNIRTDRASEVDPAAMQATIDKFKLNAILIIGGFDALRSLHDMRETLKVPVALVPATISNNVPGTDFSLGSDTAINAVVSAIDTCKKSADSAKSRVFMIETQGRNCGFLAQMAAIAGGADIVYTQEEGVTLAQMQDDIAHIKDLIRTEQRRHFVVVRNEHCSANYDLHFMETLFTEEGKGSFSVRSVKLGHLCQGDYPSPLDRVRACLFAATGMRFLIDTMAANSADKVVVGITNSRTGVRPLHEVCTQACWDKRLATAPRWLWTLPLNQYLAGYRDTRSASQYTALVNELCEECDSAIAEDEPDRGLDASSSSVPTAVAGKSASAL